MGATLSHDWSSEFAGRDNTRTSVVCSPQGLAPRQRWHAELNLSWQYSHSVLCNPDSWLLVMFSAGESSHPESEAGRTFLAHLSRNNIRMVSEEAVCEFSVQIDYIIHDLLLPARKKQAHISSEGSSPALIISCSNTEPSNLGNPIACMIRWTVLFSLTFVQNWMKPQEMWRLSRPIDQAFGRWLPTAKAQGSSPGRVVWDLWWPNQHCAIFSPSTSVSLENHSTDCSTFIIIIHHPSLV
jgi:hypothetical protein